MRRIHVSRCTGPYRYDLTTFGERALHVRPVRYLMFIARAELPLGVQTRLSGRLTVFRADPVWPFVREALREAERPTTAVTP